MPPREVPPRAHRPLRAFFVFGAAVAVCCGIVVERQRLKQKDETPSAGMCHPNLARLRGRDGREVLLIGTLPLDLDGASSQLVRDALAAQKPDVVMVEGTPPTALNAMLMSGRWDVLGVKKPNDTEWMDLGPDVKPVELPTTKKRRGFLQLISGSPPTAPETSLVPVKVGFWAYHLRGSVGQDVATAVSSAAAKGVPLRFLGPANGGFQGHIQVSMLAEQAAREMIEEEQRKGQMSSNDMNEALKRAETHMKEDAGKWLRDNRGETARIMSSIKEKVSKEVADSVAAKIEEHATFMVNGISKTMEEFHRGAVLISVDQVVNIEAKLNEAGYIYVSDCA